MARKITMAMTGRTRVQSLGADTVLQAAATVLLPGDNRYREGGRGRGDTSQRIQNTPPTHRLVVNETQDEDIAAPSPLHS